ncbi:MAG TPA: carboxypeptidase regulatory-like domain-containing protein [Bryobacteraceae bacterium]|nr:carboxypeptidase regulatory-like domain-containing protein [Bryobacteraceae bacterium]
MGRRLTLPLFSLVLLIPVPALSAQSTFGGIVGIVTDASGALVPAAAIKAREIDTNTLRSATTDAGGLYEILNLKPGRYEITAIKTGFATARIAEARLEARHTLRADLSLQLAPHSETLVVAERLVPLINTETGIIAHTKTFDQITQLPLNYRGVTTSPLAVLFAVPGVHQDAGDRPSIAGGMPAQVEYSLDGISTANVSFFGPNPDMYPSTEMLSELKVTSVDNSAEFGQMGDVTVITKAGANYLHGSALWYHQNAALDAKSYGSPEKQAKVGNTFGGSLAGPVFLPKLYSGRDKTFFFVDYEGNRRPGSFPVQHSVPTADMRSGNLSGVPGPPAVDPLSGAPFPGNQVPLTQINSVARALLDNYYPLPNYNFDGTTNSNYRRLFRNAFDTDGYDTRIDHILTSRQQLCARWSWKKQASLGYLPFLPESSVRSYNKNLVVSHNSSFTPRLLNEFRFGVSLSTFAELFPVQGSDAVAVLRLQGLDLSHVPDGRGFPYFNFGDGTGFTAIGHGRDGISRSSTYQYTDNLSWRKGRHALKFGADLRRLGYGNTARGGWNDDFGGWVFNQGTFSGNALADLLLGLPTTSNLAIIGPDFDERATHYHFYGQDAWRVNERLTASFGLRWQLHPAMMEASGNITNFNPVTRSVIVPDHSLPAAPGFLVAINACPGYTSEIPCTPMITASQAGLPQGLRRTYYGNWTPRFGIAWRPFANNKTVVRGGFGVFTHTVLGQFAGRLTAIHTSDERTYANYQGPGLPPLFTLPQTYAGDFALPDLGSEDFGEAISPSYRDPRAYQWNVTVERELPNKSSLRLSYVGTRSIGLNLLTDLNQQHGGTTPFSASRRPYPQFNRLYSFENLGFAAYDGAEAEFVHRFSRTLFFQSSYVFSKLLGNAGSSRGGAGGGSLFPGDAPVPLLITDRFNTRLDRGPLGASRRHRLLVNGIYQLPVGKRRKWGARMSSVPNAFVGGWDLSTVTLVESGPFQTPTIAARFDQSNTGMLSRGVPLRPDRIGDGNLSHPTLENWYDIAAFVPPPAGSGRFGNSGVGILRGPGLVTVAVGLFKSFPLSEQLHMRLEATFTNVANHPNFAAPPVNVSQPVSFGKITSTVGQQNSGSRVGQIAARLDW